MKTVKWLREKIKNLPDEHPLYVVDNGVWRKVEDGYFDPECFIIVPEEIPPIKILQISVPQQAIPRAQDLDFNLLKILSLGAGHKIHAIKVCREISGMGLKEAKDYVEALMANHHIR